MRDIKHVSVRDKNIMPVIFMLFILTKHEEEKILFFMPIKLALTGIFSIYIAYRIQTNADRFSVTFLTYVFRGLSQYFQYRIFKHSIVAFFQIHAYAPFMNVLSDHAS
jgi:ABC-type uncharacterized transport system permease subunit